jgi:hypothetical protein
VNRAASLAEKNAEQTINSSIVASSGASSQITRTAVTINGSYSSSVAFRPMAKSNSAKAGTNIAAVVKVYATEVTKKTASV